ncbi:hypothetical protein Cabys_3310 [Caldithrix abyssi DSM 13497]|uniref:Uncharacterized protein n=1 Tax=Caldithrix abyssi DSM 13497 TaxID=880073 RepID=A0A1J1CDJ8_CALAY|nr:hypothetical protein Cabys_3310 [Caldithrix abyssi DSM 13497]
MVTFPPFLPSTFGVLFWDLQKVSKSEKMKKIMMLKRNMAYPLTLDFQWNLKK